MGPVYVGAVGGHGCVLNHTFDGHTIHAIVESTDQCNTCVKTSYFDHFLVGNYGTHETVVLTRM